jgi:hypothetical protein
VTKYLRYSKEERSILLHGFKGFRPTRFGCHQLFNHEERQNIMMAGLFVRGVFRKRGGGFIH